MVFVILLYVSMNNINNIKAKLKVIFIKQAKTAKCTDILTSVFPIRGYFKYYIALK